MAAAFYQKKSNIIKCLHVAQGDIKNVTSLNFLKSHGVLVEDDLVHFLPEKNPNQSKGLKTYFSSMSAESKTGVGAVCTVLFALFRILKIQQ